MDGQTVNLQECDKEGIGTWLSMEDDGTIRAMSTGHCLTVAAELEVWAGPLADGSQAVVLLNRGDSHRETITVQWIDIGFPPTHAALVRDLWERKDVGTFTGSYTSPNIEPHSVMMLKISLVNTL